jgi:hypothetical protein
MTKRIEIIISPTGETRLETMGFEGTACREASRFVEEALGQRIAEQRTPEFYRSASEATQASHVSQGP